MTDKAVLCGINNYELISDLSGCINDVKNIHKLLTEELNFDSNNIRTFFDEEVTKKTIHDAFKWLAEGAQASDRLVFHFSGHGSYTNSKDTDEELDELICLYNMNWADTDSYLIDDDLGDLTRLVKLGRLTVILDSCHSGSGTRAITSNFALARSVSPKLRLIIVDDTVKQISSSPVEDTLRRLTEGNSALFRSFLDERERPVFARFVEPPVAYRPKAGALRVKHLGASMRAELNHQLLAGARDDQTAADAFIDGAYNGAFTFYLCDTLRNQGLKSYNEVMDETARIIKSKGYSQEPQNEGPFGDETFMGGTTPNLVANPHLQPSLSEETIFVETESDDPAKAMSELPDEAHPLNLLADLLRVSEKLIDISSETRKVDSSFISHSRGPDDEVIVYVHGISTHQPGYSTTWFDAVRPYLAHSIERKEVLWSQLVNSRSGSAEVNLETRLLAQEIEQELTQRSESINNKLPNEDRQVQIERPRGSGFSIDDFTRYMLIENTREAILAQFDKVVRPLLAQAKKVHIVSHSWGTVVSYEGLRRMDTTRFPGRVANLFVVGSALSISAVQSNLFSRVSDGRKPQAVDRIINLDAGGDIVGGPIGEHFMVHREYMGLAPVGCSTIVFSNIAINPSCAHSSYFKSANVEVNRDIFAHFINLSQ